MKQDPEIVKLLREEEKQGKLSSQHQSECEEPERTEEQTEEESLDVSVVFSDDKIPLQKRMELGDPRDNYRIIFENSAIAITLADEKERIVSWNKYMENLLNMTHKDLFLRSVRTLYPVEEWRKLRAENIRQKGIQHHTETRMIQKDGKIIDVDLSLSVLRDHTNKVIGSIGIIKDISKNKDTERALRSSEEKFKLLYEKAPVPYHMLSPEGKITNVNEKWCRLFGYSKKEVIGRPIFHFIRPEERWTAEASFKEKIQSKQFYTGGHERTYLTKEGEERVFVISDFLLLDEENTVVSVHTTMEDITERKKMEVTLRLGHDELEQRVHERTSELSRINTRLRQEITEHEQTEKNLQNILTELKESQRRIELQNYELRKLDQMKSDFINITSHELRTPMSSIKGYVEMMLMETLGGISDEQKKGLEVVLRNSDRLDHLIQDILDISRLESGKMRFVPEKTDMKKIIDHAIETMQSCANQKNIKINLEKTDELPELIVDKDRITQVMMNILNNAIKFSPDGSVINVRVKSKQDEVLFEIQDFGRGIPLDKQAKIFHTFYQVDSGMDRKFGGAGLGLSISRGIVVAHGGRIWVESTGKSGDGCVFRFTLPVKPILNMEENFDDLHIFDEHDMNKAEA